MWRRKHRRGGALSDKIGDILIGQGNGSYAISYSDGRRVWHQLGYSFNWLLKLFDLLGIDCEGDQPERIWHGDVLTRSGRLLNAATGKVKSRHSLEYTTVEYNKHNSYGAYQELASVDGESVAPFHSARDRDGFPIEDHDTKQIELLLAKSKLELANLESCVTSAHGITIAVACNPPQESGQSPQSRLYAGGSSRDIPHFLIVCDEKGTLIHERFYLGDFYHGEIDWADPNVFSVTTQTNRQWKWSNKRHLWLFEWSRINELLTSRCSETEPEGTF
jgi:hypothetical protein